MSAAGIFIITQLGRIVGSNLPDTDSLSRFYGHVVEELTDEFYGWSRWPTPG
jgi:hypothetical protein